MTMDKAMLSGTPDEVRRKIENLTPSLAPEKIRAGERFRILAAELAQRDGVTVSAVTYGDQSQELRVILANFPDSGQIIIDRNPSGDHCLVSWECLLSIRDQPGIKTTADLIVALLGTGARRRM